MDLEWGDKVKIFFLSIAGMAIVFLMVYYIPMTEIMEVRSESEPGFVGWFTLFIKEALCFPFVIGLSGQILLTANRVDKISCRRALAYACSILGSIDVILSAILMTEHNRWIPLGLLTLSIAQLCIGVCILFIRE